MSVTRTYKNYPIFDGVSERLQERAIDFHIANPLILDYFVNFTRQAKNAGKMVGPQAVWERIRWELLINTTDPASHFKVNDAYKAWYSRFAMYWWPSLSSYFKTRERV